MLVLFSFAPSIILFPLFNFTLYPSNPPKIKRILTKYKQQEKNLVGVWGFGKLTINLNVIQKHRLGFLGLSLKLEWNLLQRHHFQRKVAYFISKRAYFFSRIWINWKMWLSWKENWVDCLLFVYTTLAVTVRLSFNTGWKFRFPESETGKREKRRQWFYQSKKDLHLINWFKVPPTYLINQLIRIHGPLLKFC